MDKELFSELIGERVALDLAIPEMKSQIGEYTITGDPKDLQIPEKFTKMIAEIGDTKPMFLTVAVPIGKSRVLTSSSNPAEDRAHRLWPEHVMDTLVERIKESGLPGYRGHATDLDNVPDTTIMWVSATKGQKVTGEKAVLARGYVYDVNNNRYFLKTGAFNTVSPMAMSRVTPEVAEDGEPVMLVEQANWLSLDFVRPNTEGIRGAAVVSMEGAKTGMTLTPEMRKIITELALKDLQELNPALVSEIAKSAAPTSNAPDNTLVTSLTGRIQELVQENATLAIENSYLSQVATILGCKTGEVPSRITELKTLQANAANIAKETAIAKLGNNPLRDVVAKRLKDTQFGSVQEAEEAVTKEVATAKEYIAAMGGQFNLGGINSTVTIGGSGTSVLSGYGQQLVVFRRGFELVLDELFELDALIHGLVRRLFVIGVAVRDEDDDEQEFHDYIQLGSSGWLFGALHLLPGVGCELSPHFAHSRALCSQ